MNNMIFFFVLAHKLSLLIQIKPIKSSLSSLPCSLVAVCYYCGIVVKLYHLKVGGDTTTTLTIWPAYYALAEHLNESPQPDRDILLSPHRHINMQAHGFIDAKTQTCTKSANIHPHMKYVDKQKLECLVFFLSYTHTHTRTHY